MDNLDRLLSDKNRVFLKEFAESTKGFIAMGKRTNKTCPSSGRVLCKEVKLLDIEIDADNFIIYQIGDEIDHTYIDADLLRSNSSFGNNFLASVEVEQYTRRDQSKSYGFKKLPAILDLQIGLKIAIDKARAPSNLEKRRENADNLATLLYAILKLEEEAKGLDKLAVYHLEPDLLNLGFLTIETLDKSIERSMKMKKKKSKGFNPIHAPQKDALYMSFV